jgi:hypothetical protein
VSVHRRALAVLAAAAAVTSAITSVQTAVPAAAHDTGDRPAHPPASYTVTVDGVGSWTNPDDTPASPFIDRDGTFYYEQAHALYGADDPREWLFYTGDTLDDAAPATDINDAVDPANPLDRNSDTTWRCNNSPTGLEATPAPAGSGYSQRNYCDVVGVWVDPDTGDWYGLVHNEFTPQPFGDGLHFDAIDYAVSTDHGRTWAIKDHVITSPYSTTRGDTAAFPQQTYYYGDGDQRLYVDAASGYFYVFYGSRVVDKGGSWKAFYAHVARAPIAAKMAPGSWRKWYAGHWSQPGVGGKESNLVPVTAADRRGYTDPDDEYDPTTPGTTSQQIAAGETPPTSPLFVMDITYNAYLGLYIGEPQAVDQSGNAPQQYYATDDLTTQRWHLIGDTGSYHTASWYRWFLDDANATSSTIVGKTFRSYCSYACSPGSDSEYTKVTIDSSAPDAPIRSGRSYRVAAANGRVLAQVGHSGRTTSTPGHHAAHRGWTFTATGDGSYTIANATGHFLGVDSSSTDARAWGTRPVVAAAGADGPTLGQQWFVVPNTSARTGRETGTYRLVNRYSGLVLGLSADRRRAAETTPVRSWTDREHGSVGAGRTSAEQTLRITPLRH